MDINKFVQSKIFKGVILVIAGLLILLVGFKVGTMVGSRKAEFSGRWGDNYHRNFGGPKNGFMGGFGDRNFLEASGTFGQIIKIDGNSLTVKGARDVEKIVLVTDSTVINRLRETLKATDLKIDDSIVTIGEPNAEGQIEAKLIRVMPLAPVKAKPFGLLPTRDRLR